MNRRQLVTTLGRVANVAVKVHHRAAAAARTAPHDAGHQLASDVSQVAASVAVLAFVASLPFGKRPSSRR